MEINGERKDVEILLMCVRNRDGEKEKKRKRMRKKEIGKEGKKAKDKKRVETKGGRNNVECVCL